MVSFSQAFVTSSAIMASLNAILLSLLPYLSTLVAAIVGVILLMYGRGRKNSGLPVLAAAVIAFGLYVLIDTNPKVGATVSAFSTAAVAAVAVIQIDENRKLKKRDTAERQLREILAWVVEIKNSSLINLPSDMVFADQNRVEAYVKYNTQVSYARVLNTADMAESVALRSFKAELLEDVRLVIRNLLAVRFVELPTKSGLRGEYLEVVSQIEGRLSKEKREDLLREYAEGLAVSTKRLCEKVLGLISEL